MCFVAFALTHTAHAAAPVGQIEAGVPSPEEVPAVVVEGRAESLVGIAESAAQGEIGEHELQIRPLLRNGEILEAVPGVIITQHSGSGKANQYFLRGFNLDHGTDFAVTVDGMPVNMRTHAHGQGYSDLNFIIPELVEKIDYKKGVYYSEEGDFASAGAATFRLRETVDRGIGALTIGQDQFGRALAVDSLHLGEGNMLLAVELQHYNGPWELEEKFRKLMRWCVTAEEIATMDQVLLSWVTVGYGIQPIRLQAACLTVV